MEFSFTYVAFELIDLKRQRLSMFDPTGIHVGWQENKKTKETFKRLKEVNRNWMS